MAKKELVQLRVHVNHKESMRAWADRLGITLTMLYQVLAGMNGPEELTRIVMTEFACKHLQRMGLPPYAPLAIQAHEQTHEAFCLMLATAARLELADATGDVTTADATRAQMDVAEANLLRAFGAAIKEYQS